VKYIAKVSVKKQQRAKLAHRIKTSTASLMALGLVLAAGSTLSVVSAKGGTGGGTTVDASVCNTAATVLDYNATFPAGTIKAGVTPEFQITGSSTCPVQFNARFVSITKAYTYDLATRSYVLAELPGYPVTEVSKDVVIKPGAFSIKNRIADKPVSGVYQMFTEVQMYMSTSFDASGALLPDAVLLGTDVANWTQTNFITL
jgi:hypothetical protein